MKILASLSLLISMHLSAKEVYDVNLDGLDLVGKVIKFKKTDKDNDDERTMRMHCVVRTEDGCQAVQLVEVFVRNNEISHYAKSVDIFVVTDRREMRKIRRQFRREFRNGDPDYMFPTLTLFMLLSGDWRNPSDLELALKILATPITLAADVATLPVRPVLSNSITRSLKFKNLLRSAITEEEGVIMLKRRGFLAIMNGFAFQRPVYYPAESTGSTFQPPF